MLLSELIKKKDKIRRIVNKNKGSHVSVFGSTADGSATENSDVDFLVTFQDDASLFDLIEIKIELEELLGNKVDVVSEKGLKNNEIGKSIRRSAVSI